MPELKPAEAQVSRGFESHPFRQTTFGVGVVPSATNKKAPSPAGPFAFRYRIDYSSVFAKFIAAGMSGSWVTSGTTWM